MNIMAIDPGKVRGGAAAFHAWGESIFDLPYDENGRPDIEWLQERIIHYKIDVMVIEEQQVRGGQAGQAGIAIGYGMMIATAILCGVEVVELHPKTWQGVLGLSGDKQEHVDYAEAAGFDIPWTSYKKNGEPMARAKKHDGMGDAVCIGLAYREMTRDD